MNKRYAAFSILTVFLLSCQTLASSTATPAAAPSTPTVAAVSPTSTPELVGPDSPTQTEPADATPSCISSKPTQADIDRALTYAERTFSSWERNHSVSDARVAVTWMDASQDSVAYIEALIFECGYDEAVLDGYFSDASWQTIFSNYDSYELVRQCASKKGVRLYQFQAKNRGMDYMIGYWTVNDTDTRVMVAMIVVPLESQVRLWAYGASLFPELPNCS